MKTLNKLIALAMLCLLPLAACKAGPVDISPTEFIDSIAKTAGDGGEKALSAYVGRTCNFNARADKVVPGEYLKIVCSYQLELLLCLSPDELDKIEKYDVLGFEGTVKEIEAGEGQRIRVIMDPVRVTDYTFQVTGKAEHIFNNFNQDGNWVDQDGNLLEEGWDVAMFLDDSVIKGRQIDVYLPEGHGIQEGDSITVRGKITCPEYYYGVTWIEDVPKQLVMLEPELDP